MKYFLMSLSILCSLSSFAQTANEDPDFIAYAKKINAAEIETLAVQSNGRVKPLHSYAHESVLFLTGKNSIWGLDPIQFYVGLITYDRSENLEMINIRDPELRVTLGFEKKRRLFSISELKKSQLGEMAKPLIEKQQATPRAVTPNEKNVLEAYHQLSLAQAIMTGDHLASALDVSFVSQSHGADAKPSIVLESLKKYLTTIAQKGAAEASESAQNLRADSLNQAWPELLEKKLKYLNLEVFYNKAHIFLFTSIYFFMLSILMFITSNNAKLKARLTPKRIGFLYIPALLMIAGGFAMRVTITGFAPVTNMYGTMLWVSFGVSIFNLILFLLYKNYTVAGLVWFGCASILLLTENIPLVLSPDLDPIVAVLRSNLWLTIHVLTITISYAAFTVTMLIGNAGLVRTLIKPNDTSFHADYAHLAYRATQLGVFLISVGIILGGVWADYSWGRFWGWDPKETWALIADLGYIAILHARIIGWLTPFGILMATPLAYLLVIMAWYGVNFILATGLHSYGFSSGGQTIVFSFVSFQITLILIVVAIRYFRKSSQSTT